MSIMCAWRSIFTLFVNFLCLRISHFIFLQLFLSYWYSNSLLHYDFSHMTRQEVIVHVDETRPNTRRKMRLARVWEKAFRMDLRMDGPMDRWTYGWTYGRTDRQTNPLKEMLSASKNISQILKENSTSTLILTLLY